MKNNFIIFIITGITVGVSAGVANNNIPGWTSWGIVVGAGARLLIESFLKRKKFGRLF